MPRYVTVGQFRAADMGIPGVTTTANSGVPDATIARYLAQAESDVDAFVGFPLYQPAGFAPGIVQSYQEPFDLGTRRTRIPTWPVPVRQILRYQIQISNASTTGGAGLYASVNKFDAIFNDSDGYIEIVPLQLTYSGLAAVWSLALNPPIVQVDYEAGFFLQALGDPLFNDSGDLKTYRSLRSSWVQTYTLTQFLQPLTLPPVPPVVYKNGTVVGAANYSVNYVEGVVTFTSANLATDVITADICFAIPDPVRDATIFQATWLLGQRTLTQLGVLGLDLARSGGREVRRGKANDDGGALTVAARDRLAPYRPLAAG